MNRFVNCFTPTDYEDIKVGVDTTKDVTQYMKNHGCIIEIPVEPRWWEYGSGVQLFVKQFLNSTDVKVLNVGSGRDAIGPTLACTYDVYVTECEPDATCRKDRELVNQVLDKAKKRRMKVIPNSVHDLPEEEFDAVFCISVLEHVHNEEQAWKNLAERVKPGGLLFVTVDCVENPEKPYFCDNLRVTKYTMGILAERVAMIVGMDFDTLGEPDYTWTGAHVYDYNFFRAGFIKNEG